MCHCSFNNSLSVFIQYTSEPNNANQ
ncbi:hypothetical protein V12B01_12740 [Vibrio splendidus 12B01]|nr:hypothetical protein V12B01_12740 [Vibrio splendidus 12B01]